MPTITPEQYAESLHKAGQGGLSRVFANNAKRLALFAEGQGRKNATDRLRVRSGNLRRSITGTVRGHVAGADVELSAGGRVEGGDVPYAGTQEFGATIRPVRRKWLALPTRDVQTAAGVSRYATPRDYPSPLVFIQKGEGRAFLLDPADGRAKWALRKQVTIKPKFYLRDAMRETERMVPVEMASALGVALNVEPPGAQL